MHRDGCFLIAGDGLVLPQPFERAQDLVAVGGRGTLVGPILGAFAVNGAKTWFTVAYPELWLYFLGLLFVLVTLFLPRGLAGLVATVRARLPGRPVAKHASQASVAQEVVS